MRHPDAAKLLACIDGELDAWNGWRVRRHVERCWQCRARVADLESAIGAVNEILEPAAVDPVDLAKARWKFRQAASQVNREIEPRRGSLAPAFILAAATAVFFAFLVLPPRKVPEPAASALLAKARSAETPGIRAAVREERYSVEYSRGSVPPTRRELRILASPVRSAWTARWSTQSGELQSALFAADSREFTKKGGLRPAVYGKSATYKSLVDYVRGDPQDLEAMILSWIRDQVWQPVSLAREVAEFCTRSGAVLRISAQGTAVLWTAESTLDGTTFQVHLEGIQGQAPALLRIAWHSPRGSGAVRVKREWRRDYDDVRLAAALLYPNFSRRSQEEANSQRLPEAPQLLRAGPSVRDLLSAEVVVLHAVHRAGLCKADEVAVARTPHAVEVSGAFAGEEQTEKITLLLSGIPHVRLRLTTMDLSSAPALQDYSSSPERNTRAAAAEPWLRARLGVGLRASEREMFNTMNAVVRDSEDLLSESWALLRLSRRFPVELENEMDEETRARVRQMADDHIVRMSVHLAAIDGRLALQHGAPSISVEQVPWQAGSSALHEGAKHAAEVLLSLFASGEPVRVPSPTDPEQAGVPTLIGRVRSMATHVRAELGADYKSAHR